MAVETATTAYMQPPRRVRRPRRGYTKTALIAWLDEQERLIRMRARPTEVVKEFDPLENLPEPQDERGRRTISFRFNANLERSIADQIQAKIVENVRSRFMLKLSALVELRHTEEADRKMDFYQRDNGVFSLVRNACSGRELGEPAGRAEVGKLANARHQMDLREDKEGVCQSHLGPPSFVSRERVST